MSLSRNTIILFRILLIISLVLITYLVTTELKHPLMTSVNDKLGHIASFIFLSFLMDFSFPANRFGLMKILPLLAYGILIETIQYFLPYRTFSFLDVFADGVGIAIYALLIPMLRHVPYLKPRWVE